MCLETYELDPARFLPAPGLVWQVALKKDQSKMIFLNNIDTLLMIEKGIRGYVKANNKYIKNYDKNKESSYLKYWDVNNWYGWAIL